MKKVLITSMLLLLTVFMAISQKMVILGTSTAKGTGSTPGNSWVEKFGQDAIQKGFITQLINLATPTVTHKIAMPDWYGTADTARNIDKAKRLGATYVVVSFVSNGYDYIPVSEVVSDFKIIKRRADSLGMVCFFTTTQPRNTFSLTERGYLKAIADLMLAEGMYLAIDFYYPLVDLSTLRILPQFSYGDDVHVNEAGHDTLAKQAINANLFIPRINAGPDTSTTSSNTSLTGSILNMGVGRHKVVMLLYDSSGNLLSVDSTNITRQAILPPPPPDTTSPPDTTTPPVSFKSVKVNVFGGTNPYTIGNWNNWNVSAGLQSAALKYDDGTTSTINASLSASSIADNGSLYGGVMCPAPVLRYVSWSTSNRTLAIKGLNSSSTYTIEFYASRNNAGNSTTFTINGVSKTVVTDVNLTNKIVFTGISPNVNGQITVTLARIGTYNYLNGFIITETQQQSNSFEAMPVIDVAMPVTTNIDKIIVNDLSGRLIATETNPVGDRYLKSLQRGTYIISGYYKNNRTFSYKYFKGLDN